MSYGRALHRATRKHRIRLGRQLPRDAWMVVLDWFPAFNRIDGGKVSCYWAGEPDPPPLRYIRPR